MNTPDDSGISQTDPDRAGSVVKVEGKRMKERIFLLVLGQPKNICGIFLYLVEHVRHIQKLTV